MLCLPARRTTHRSGRSGLAALGALSLAFVAPSQAAQEASAAHATRVPGVEAEVQVTGMTLVVSRQGQRDLVLEARRATLRPETNKALLFDAQMRTAEGPRGRQFDVYCDRGELDLESNDFLAEGNVHGRTGEGQRYEAPWVRYETARGLLYTDAPVVLRDGGGTYRGDGFRYHVNEQRFELLGNVSVVHTP
jgi:LPS export ABC transporter protein LptC